MIVVVQSFRFDRQRARFRAGKVHFFPSLDPVTYCGLDDTGGVWQLISLDPVSPAEIPDLVAGRPVCRRCAASLARLTERTRV